MKVLFITNLPSPYRVDFFNELGKYCDLTVCYERKYATNRDKRWDGDSAVNYIAHFTSAKTIGADKSIGLDLIREIKKVPFDRLIITGYASPSVMLAISYCCIRKISYIIESDGGFFTIDSGARRLLKRFLLCGATAHYTTCEEYISYLTNIGIQKEIIHKYPFTSLNENDIARVPATNEEKNKIRAELGIIEDKVVLSVGRLIPGKGFDVLLDAAKNFQQGTGVYIVGGTPSEEYIIQKEKLGLENVHFIDFKKKDELKKWYRAADVFVLPTRSDVWGLVINEAMAQGIPVVTTDKCIAGLELIRNGLNGYIIRVDDVSALIDSVNTLLLDEKLVQKIGKENIMKIKKYTIQNMAKEHMRFFDAKYRCS